MAELAFERNGLTKQGRDAMNKSTVKTFTATLYVGRKNRATGQICPLNNIKKAVRCYVDSVGLCVTVTPTEFFYTNGNEAGVAIGFINYPRFPNTRTNIRKQALELGKILKKICKQLRVSIVFPNETIMI